MNLKTKLIVCLLPLTTGCASAVNTMALFYDQRDPCQTLNKPPGHQRPAWCGTASARSAITTPQGQVIGYIRK